MFLCDLHEYSNSETFDVSSWSQIPNEAKGGHELVANCLAGIRSKFSFTSIKP